MDLLKVSVIIPCYNMEKYLDECMASVLGQTLDDIEIICIDDGSVDQTPDMLDKYQQRNSRVIVIHQENQGVAAARNTGIRIARGEYIAFIDPDDFYPENRTLELLYSKAAGSGALICGGSFSSYHNADGHVSTRYAGDYAGYTFHKEGFVDYQDYQFDFGYHRFLYRRDFLIENGIFFPPYVRFQDPPFFVKAMITAKAFYAVPNVVYRYREDIQAEPTTWPRAKLQDMLRGHLDNLQLSVQARLCDLHTLTVRRLEAPNVYKPVMQALRDRDTQTLNLLMKINAAIDTDLLRQAGTRIPADDCYILKELGAILDVFAGTPVEPRHFGSLVRGGIRCCREHGFFYTVKRAITKTSRRKKNNA